MRTQRLSQSRGGFTLIEVLVVISIIALLSGMGFTGLRMANQKSKDKQTANRLAAFSSSVEQYRIDKGEYPIPARYDDMTSVKGEAWRVGGAKALYQALSGDGNDALRNGQDRSNGEQASSGKLYFDQVFPPTQEELDKGQKSDMVEIGDDNSFYVIDGYRHPIQYRVAEVDINGLVLDDGAMFSGGRFEMYSYGRLESPDDTPDAQGSWIKSWER
jgi:prepilin-type N-terminal cleavage/methylation domain-containing protein